MKYNIVLEDNKDMVLASCNTKEAAEMYLEQMKKVDRKLKKYYNWSRVPKYEIIEREGK